MPIPEQTQVSGVPLDYQSIFDRLPGQYLLFDKDYYILAANDAFLESSLTEREEIVGKYLFDVFPENPADTAENGEQNLKTSLERVVKTLQRDSMAIQKYDIRRKDGSFETRYWSPLNIPLLNDKGELECILQQVEDVTDYVQLRDAQKSQSVLNRDLQMRMAVLETEIVQRSKDIQNLNASLGHKVQERTQALVNREEELSAQNKKLSSQNRELEQFTYVASHDLQEPLRSLSSLTDLLQNEHGADLSEQGKTYLNFIKQCSSRMQQLVGGLLNYARLGKEQERSEVNCNELVSQVLDDLSLRIREQNAQLAIDDLPTLIAYPIELRSLFQNLIGNALKFTRKNVLPIIQISAQKSGNKWRFMIKDNGIGIEGKDVNKLFIIFKRLHNRKDYEGTGIGLAMCKKIVDLHDGEIWVESEPGKGSNFIFTLSQ